MRTFQFFNQKSTSELEQEFTISNSNDLISTLKGFISFKNLTFKSHDKVYFLSSSFPFLFSFGADSNFISLKVFNLSKLDSSSSSPVLVRSSKLSSAFPVTTCAFNSTLDKLAIGFENGLLILMSGSLTNSRLSSHKTILESQTSISLLHFTPSNHLFCVSFNQILVFSPDLKSSLLDDFGANFNCACGYNDQILVAKPEAIYFYGIDGRGPCSIIQGEKTLISTYKQYLVVISKEKKSEDNLGNILTIYDLKNKFTAHTAKFDNDLISTLVPQQSNLLVMTRSSKVYQLSELDLSSRLDILYSQDMFSLAITIAQSSPQSLFEIYKRYGDFLYSKSEYDSAMTQYCKTIGSLEPSYVIRKYLDAQRILNLSFYLQMLHSNNVATSDHTTLLINCFTKLANINQLNIFLEDDKTSFDVDVAIKVCRDAGYFSHASNLSKKFNRHEWFLKIQIEDLKDYKTAIEYVSKLNISDSLAFLKMYGYLLVQYNASEMISVLIQVCTTQQCNPDEFTKLFLNKHDDCISFLKQVLLKKNMIQSTSLFKIYNILLELYISSDDNVDFYRREALELMMDKEAVYNLDHVLILCKLNNFVKGTLYCYQKRGMYSEIINHHLLNNQFDAVLDICRQGNWIDVLTNFANLPELSLDSLTFLSKLLNELIDFDIDTSQVLNILSINKSINIGLLAPFITQRNDLIQSSIQQDLDLISKLKQETAQLETILNEYSNPIVFQNTRCCICERPLELPTINFLCKHSFHQRCIGADDHCSVCFQEHQAVRDIQVGIVNVDHEGFRQELEGKRDDERFKFIAEYFGRDVFKIKE